MMRPEVSTFTRPTARTEHQCYECWTTIHPGEDYVRIDGRWDTWETYKFCSECWRLWQHQDELGPYGDLVNKVFASPPLAPERAFVARWARTRADHYDDARIAYDLADYIEDI